MSKRVRSEVSSAVDAEQIRVFDAAAQLPAAVLACRRVAHARIGEYMQVERTASPGTPVYRIHRGKYTGPTAVENDSGTTSDDRDVSFCCFTDDTDVVAAALLAFADSHGENAMCLVAYASEHVSHRLLWNGSSNAGMLLLNTVSEATVSRGIKLLSLSSSPPCSGIL